MAVSEIDIFYFKLKNLLISGQSANLTLPSEAGKASLSLNVEVNMLEVVLQDNAEESAELQLVKQLQIIEQLK